MFDTLPSSNANFRDSNYNRINTADFEEHDEEISYINYLNYQGNYCHLSCIKRHREQNDRRANPRFRKCYRSRPFNGKFRVLSSSLR